MYINIFERTEYLDGREILCMVRCTIWTPMFRMWCSFSYSPSILIRVAKAHSNILWAASGVPVVVVLAAVAVTAEFAQRNGTSCRLSDNGVTVTTLENRCCLSFSLSLSCARTSRHSCSYTASLLRSRPRENKPFPLRLSHIRIEREERSTLSLCVQSGEAETERKLERESTLDSLMSTEREYWRRNKRNIPCYTLLPMSYCCPHPRLPIA